MTKHQGQGPFPNRYGPDQTPLPSLEAPSSASASQQPRQSVNQFSAHRIPDMDGAGGMGPQWSATKRRRSSHDPIAPEVRGLGPIGVAPGGLAGYGVPRWRSD